MSLSSLIGIVVFQVWFGLVWKTKSYLQSDVKRQMETHQEEGQHGFKLKPWEPLDVVVRCYDQLTIVEFGRRPKCSRE